MDKILAPIKKRILEYIDYKRFNKGEFFENLKISSSNFRGNGLKSEAGGDVIAKILTNHVEINPEWLMTGEGKMIKEEQKIIKTDEAALITDKSIVQIPLVGQYAYAGYLGGFDDSQYMEALPTVPIFVDRELKGNYLGFEVRGDSMEDGTDNSIKEGDILISREVKQEYWKYKLHINKWNFVIVHKTEGILIKRIIKHEVEKATITIHSLNSLYKDMELSLNDIVKLFNVVQVVRKFKI